MKIAKVCAKMTPKKSKHEFDRVETIVSYYLENVLNAFDLTSLDQLVKTADTTIELSF